MAGCGRATRSSPGDPPPPNTPCTEPPREGRGTFGGTFGRTFGRPGGLGFQGGWCCPPAWRRVGEASPRIRRAPGEGICGSLAGLLLPSPGRGAVRLAHLHGVQGVGEDRIRRASRSNVGPFHWERRRCRGIQVRAIVTGSSPCASPRRGRFGSADVSRPDHARCDPTTSVH